MAIFIVSIYSFRPAKKQASVQGGTVQDRCCVDGLGQSARTIGDGQSSRLSESVMN